MDLGLSADELGHTQNGNNNAYCQDNELTWLNWELDEDARSFLEFVRAMTEQGWLGMLIPERYGGGGQGMTEAAIVLEEINRSGGNGTACHAQMYTMGTVLRHGSEDQKQRYLPGIARGELRLQAFGVTEPDAGSDTTRISTTAARRGDVYVVNGQKVFTSRVENSDLMLLLARTSPVPERVEDRTQGLSVFLVDLRDARGHFEYQRMDIMFNHHTYQCFFNELEVPAQNLVGKRGAASDTSSTVGTPTTRTPKISCNCFAGRTSARRTTRDSACRNSTSSTRPRGAEPPCTLILPELTRLARFILGEARATRLSR